MPADTHIKLHHFVSVEQWPAVRAAHVIALSDPLNVRVGGQERGQAWPAVVWLTSDPSHAHARPAVREIPDSSAVRITVRVPRYMVTPFADFARRVHCPPPLLAHFKRRAPKRWPDWYIAAAAIPMAMWQHVEYDGYTLYRAEGWQQTWGISSKGGDARPPARVAR